MDTEKTENQTWYDQNLGNILSSFPARQVVPTRPARQPVTTIELHELDLPYWHESPQPTDRRMTRFQRWVVGFAILIITIPLLRIAIGLTAYWIDQRSRH